MDCMVSKDYWDRSYKNLPLTYSPNRILFKDLFDKYLPKGGDCLEIGCYPGDYLIYLSKNFGYKVNGIDTSRFILDRLPAKMAKYDVEVGEFFQGDFQKFEFKRTYDLVCSFGFIEHFLNIEEVIQKHIDLVNRSGTLVLACPNFRKIQYALHYIFDADNLRRHNTHAMSLKLWEKIIDDNDMSITYQGYYQTAGFWVDNSDCHAALRRIADYVIRFTECLNLKVNYPNAFLSPYLITIAKKDN